MLPMRLPALAFLQRDRASGRPENGEIIQLPIIFAARLENLGSLRIVFDSRMLNADQLAVRTAAYEIRRFGIGDEGQFLPRRRRSRGKEILEVFSF